MKALKKSLPLTSNSLELSTCLPVIDWQRVDLICIHFQWQNLQSSLYEKWTQFRWSLDEKSLLMSLHISSLKSFSTCLFQTTSQVFAEEKWSHTSQSRSFLPYLAKLARYLNTKVGGILNTILTDITRKIALRVNQF